MFYSQGTEEDQHAAQPGKQSRADSQAMAEPFAPIGQ
jgi:hypothetical protein